MSGLIKIKFKTDQGDDVEYFPEGTSNAEMRERIAEIKAAKSQKSVVEDVVTQLGVGAAEGTAGLADAAVEAADILTQLQSPMLNPGLMQNAAASVLDFVGADETAEQIRQTVTPREYIKPGQAALDAVGLDPEMIQPTTALGGYSRTFGNFLPGVVSGPGNLARRLSSQVAAPAAGAETVGALSGALGLNEDVGRAAGAILTPMGLSAAGRAIFDRPLPVSSQREELARVLSMEGVEVPREVVAGAEKVRRAAGTERVPREARRQFSAAVAKQSGATADEAENIRNAGLTNEVMDRIETRIAKPFNEIRSVAVSPNDLSQGKLLDAASIVSQNIRASGMSGTQKSILNSIEDARAAVLSPAAGSSPAMILRDISRELSELDVPRANQSAYEAKRLALSAITETLASAARSAGRADLADDYVESMRKYNSFVRMKKARSPEDFVDPNALADAPRADSPEGLLQTAGKTILRDIPEQDRSLRARFFTREGAPTNAAVMSGAATIGGGLPAAMMALAGATVPGQLKKAFYRSGPGQRALTTGAPALRGPRVDVPSATLRGLLSQAGVQ
jgi:hypothetical protein